MAVTATAPQGPIDDCKLTPSPSGTLRARDLRKTHHTAPAHYRDALISAGLTRTKGDGHNNKQTSSWVYPTMEAAWPLLINQ